MINEFFYLIVLVFVVVILSYLYIKDRISIDIKDNEDRAYWREGNKQLITDFRLGKVVYRPDRISVADADGNIVFESPINKITLNAGNFNRGGWILFNHENSQSIHLLMRPYGNVVLFSPFAELAAEKRLQAHFKNQ